MKPLNREDICSLVSIQSALNKIAEKLDPDRDKKHTNQHLRNAHRLDGAYTLIGLVINEYVKYGE